MSEPVTEPQEPAGEPAEAPEPDEPGVSDDEASEAEEAEQTEAEQTEAEPEPKALKSESDYALERRHAAAEKKWREHEKRVRTIFEEESEYLYDCPLCAGSHPGLIDIRFAGMVQPELADAVFAYIRGAEQVTYLKDPELSRCPRCDGLGKTDTDSRVGGKDLVVCKSCKGFGYVPPPTMDRNGNVEEALVPVGVGAEEGPVSTEDVDVWGSPHYLPDGQENGNYGKMPQYKDPRLP